MCKCDSVHVCKCASVRVCRCAGVGMDVGVCAHAHPINVLGAGKGGVLRRMSMENGEEMGK